MEGIGFNSEIVLFDRGFVHVTESIWVLLQNQSDKYMLQNMEGIGLVGLHTELAI